MADPPHSVHRQPGTIKARLMLFTLCIIWGVTWPIMRIGLAEIPPLGFRAMTATIGALAVSTLVVLQRRSFRIPRRAAWLHVAVAGILNVVGFSLFSAFAQIHAATSRVTIIAYTMPIWTALLALPILGERLNTVRSAGLALCIAGMTVLVYPLASAGIPVGILLALGCAVTWAAGTVYVKWAHIEGDPIAVTAWQLITASIVIAITVPLFQGSLHLWSVHWRALFSAVFTGLFGAGIAYYLWFESVRRLPAMTAALGVLSVPAIGVTSTALILGERPTLTDLVGFVLIFAASACVLLQPQEALPARSEQT
jgi:drug/metabolite transporter (DMT)-like permease